MYYVASAAALGTEGASVFEDSARYLSVWALGGEANTHESNWKSLLDAHPAKTWWHPG